MPPFRVGTVARIQSRHHGRQVGYWGSISTRESKPRNTERVTRGRLGRMVRQNHGVQPLVDLRALLVDLSDPRALLPQAAECMCRLEMCFPSVCSLILTLILTALILTALTLTLTLTVVTPIVVTVILIVCFY
jgi:hypothetical protein